MSNGESMIKIENLSRTYTDGANKVQVLTELNLNVDRGEQLAIVGSSGSGKSTLLHLIGGLDKPTAGNVIVQGTDIHKLSAKAQGDFRNKHIGFVYQFHHLLPEFEAQDNVAMPLIIRGMKRSDAQKRANALIDKVGLSHRKTHKPSELSGGERQRIAFARALVTEPDCVLADEPTGNLDHATATHVYELMCELNREMGTTFITVTHDLELAGKMQRQLHLEDGVLSALEL
ncbi:lipoprotein-releasing ABC transporter ATP-binding protein LolD [Kangiella sediminilitoris]|uniref:Lipoprotein-releasing system ATP-binding protein LolD n=1 Tax=Kangiella sediminilitoris TaxID=1144748 RepID=A0A1B3BAQ8_9GAMM|nr:lipoprotein-releasing ABC transporter ATP-binding protein LolD [Kangiella sediminilitoris]AOE49880.1 Lipoprotein-releasing system ATP-binding protein LolD [Kangiella sediminilitoris]